MCWSSAVRKSSERLGPARHGVSSAQERRGTEPAPRTVCCCVAAPHTARARPWPSATLPLGPDSGPPGEDRLSVGALVLQRHCGLYPPPPHQGWGLGPLVLAHVATEETDSGTQQTTSSTGDCGRICDTGGGRNTQFLAAKLPWLRAAEVREGPESVWRVSGSEKAQILTCPPLLVDNAATAGQSVGLPGG